MGIKGGERCPQLWQEITPFLLGREFLKGGTFVPPFLFWLINYLFLRP